MSLFDKLAAKVMPPESDEARAEARRRAEAIAGEDGFVREVLSHHRLIERAFADARVASDAASRTAAFKQLALVLTGHANAEESVLYPSLASHGEKAGATMAYEEQAMTKIEMALLEQLEPMSQEWLDKLEHIRGAVAHHMYEEEGTWFCQLSQAVPAADKAPLTARFREEFERYVGSGSDEPTFAQPFMASAGGPAEVG